jgi:hypothetical protein
VLKRLQENEGGMSKKRKQKLAGALEVHRQQHVFTTVLHVYGAPRHLFLQCPTDALRPSTRPTSYIVPASGACYLAPQSLDAEVCGAAKLSIRKFYDVCHPVTGSKQFVALQHVVDRAIDHSEAT